MMKKQQELQKSSGRNMFKKYRKKKEINESNKGNGEDDDSKSNFSSLAVNSVSSISGNIQNGLHKTANHWQILLFGQGLSLTLAGIGATSSELYLKCSLSAPTLLLSIMYLLLSFHFVAQIIRHYYKEMKGKGRTKVLGKIVDEKSDMMSGLELEEISDMNEKQENMEIPKKQHYFPMTKFPLDCEWYLYFLVTLTDVEASYFLVLAYRYTSFTSITLLTSLSVVGAMFTSRILLKARYYPSHLIGSIVCIIGIGINLISDFEEVNDIDEYPHKVLGDVFAAIGGFLYGVNDGSSEYLLKKCNQYEFLGLSGFFGLLTCLFQIFFLEFEKTKSFFDGSSTCDVSVSTTLIIIFALTSYFKFVGDASFLILAESALLNLSLLTVDFYSTLFQIFAEQIMPSYTFFVALCFIIVGVLIYEYGPSPTHEHTVEDDLKTGTFDIEIKGVKITPFQTSALRTIT